MVFFLLCIDHVIGTNNGTPDLRPCQVLPGSCHLLLAPGVFSVGLDTFDGGSLLAGVQQGTLV